MNRQGKTHECLEEGMEAANKTCRGEIRRFTEVKKCRGERGAEGWWNMSTASSALEVKIGLGVRKLSTGSKDGKQRR